MTWLPKSVVCLSYYDRFRFRSDVFAALVLALQIFPVAIAIAVATGVHPLHGITCTAVAGLLASALGDSKIRIGGPNIIFVAVASSIVAREGVLGLSLSTLLAGVLLMFSVQSASEQRSKCSRAPSLPVSRLALPSSLSANSSPTFLASIRNSPPVALLKERSWL